MAHERVAAACNQRLALCPRLPFHCLFLLLDASLAGPRLCPTATPMSLPPPLLSFSLLLCVCHSFVHLRVFSLSGACLPAWGCQRQVRPWLVLSVTAPFRFRLSVADLVLVGRWSYCHVIAIDFVHGSWPRRLSGFSLFVPCSLFLLSAAFPSSFLSCFYFLPAHSSSPFSFFLCSLLLPPFSSLFPAFPFSSLLTHAFSTSFFFPRLPPFALPSLMTKWLWLCDI